MSFMFMHVCTNEFNVCARVCKLILCVCVCADEFEDKKTTNIIPGASSWTMGIRPHKIDTQCV